jgi:hypothetical protein
MALRNRAGLLKERTPADRLPFEKMDAARKGASRRVQTIRSAFAGAITERSDENPTTLLVVGDQTITLHYERFPNHDRRIAI